jgi:flagellar motor protein MotB
MEWNRNVYKSLGLGATRPLQENITESGREKNRRVEIKVIKL